MSYEHYIRACKMEAQRLQFSALERSAPQQAHGKQDVAPLRHPDAASRLDALTVRR